MRAPSRTAAGIAVSMFTLGVACAVLGSACNALSGIGDFEVAADASSQGGPDEGSVDGSSAGEGSAQDDGGGADVGASADAGDSGRGRGRDAAAKADSGSQASEGGNDATDDGAGDARNDARGDAGSDANPDCGASSTACDGGCLTVHSNGVGQTFTNCVPLGIINLAQALEACAAFAGDAGACTIDPITCGGGDQVCSSGSSTCACWRYSGSSAGKVGQTTTCQCLGSNSPTWN